MKTFYFSFGQGHIHKVNETIFDKDCIVSIDAECEEDARHEMFDTFGSAWCFSYSEPPEIKYFPRGIIKLESI